MHFPRICRQNDLRITFLLIGIACQSEVSSSPAAAQFKDVGHGETPRYA